jgi:hypothetical protein
MRPAIYFTRQRAKRTAGAQDTPDGSPRWPHEVSATRMFSRRSFLSIATAFFAAEPARRPKDPMPSNLDHIILGSSDLERGVAWMEERTGVRAVYGGAHPGRGTRNALLQLGPQHYLEILAPDPQQPPQNRYGDLRALHEPRLVAWAVHTTDIVALAGIAMAAGFAIIGPEDGSRARPDGETLRWKSFRLQDDRGGLLPFFIEWDRESVHPSADAPAGCRLDGFLLQSPDPPELAEACRKLDVDVTVEPGEKPLLRARISSSKHQVELTS